MKQQYILSSSSPSKVDKGSTTRAIWASFSNQHKTFAGAGEDRGI
jgi:hypothetical protein